MKKTIVFTFIFFSTFCFAQHTESYLAFADNFKILDSSKVEIKWRNGKVKERKNIRKLMYDNKEYELLTGTFLQFNRKGIKRTESLFDAYGNYLYYKFFDVEGNIMSQIITLKIDYKHNGIVEITESYEDYMKRNGDIFLYKKGKKRNNKKIGKWVTYDSCGKVIKEKTYSR